MMKCMFFVSYYACQTRDFCNFICFLLFHCFCFLSDNVLKAPLVMFKMCLIETAARETLEKVMADALSKSGSTRSAVQAVCLAVSGVNHPTDQYRILGWLRFNFCFGLFIGLSSFTCFSFPGSLICLCLLKGSSLRTGFCYNNVIISSTFHITNRNMSTSDYEQCHTHTL